MDRGEREARDLEWVNQHRLLVELAVQHFLESGDWPSIDSFQRRLDRASEPEDIQTALRAMPALPGELRTISWQRVQIPMRFLLHVPQAESILLAAFAIIRRAIEAYYSDMEPPVVGSDDVELQSLVLGRPPVVWSRAAQLALGDHPNPFAGGGWRDEWWEFHVNGSRARTMSGLKDIRDYFDWQAAQLEEAGALRGEAIAQSVGAPRSIQPTVFVIMPFGEPWSDEAYSYFVRASDAIRLEPRPTLYRIDSIQKSERITDQIVHALVTADVVLADITGMNPNVMWELGYAQALGKQVVIVNQRIADAPFDIRDIRQVPYALPTEAKAEAELTAFLRTALGPPGSEPVESLTDLRYPMRRCKRRRLVPR